MDAAVLDKFIETWGMMGSVWGISVSVARVHALLIASDEPISLDDIAGRLRISRGNASMSLKELKNWGIVRLVKVPGDRSDYYVTEPDMWKVFIVIAKERKRREFDPVLELVKETLPGLGKGSPGAVTRRLTELDRLLSTLDLVGETSLADEARARAILSLVSNFTRMRKRGKKA